MWRQYTRVRRGADSSAFTIGSVAYKTLCPVLKTAGDSLLSWIGNVFQTLGSAKMDQYRLRLDEKPAALLDLYAYGL